MKQAAFHPQRARSVQPARTRDWFALFAVFIGLLAQVLHTHPVSFASDHGNNAKHALIANHDLNADDCPLCIAAHSASPSVPSLLPPPTISLALASVEVADTLHTVQPAFQHFSRPPPAFLQ